jgi:hypothetical protein
MLTVRVGKRPSTGGDQMFTYIRELKSGNGTVAYHQDGDMLVATLWTEETDKFVAIESITFEGRDDFKAARQMMRGFVDSYAANN